MQVYIIDGNRLQAFVGPTGLHLETMETAFLRSKGIGPDASFAWEEMKDDFVDFIGVVFGIRPVSVNYL